MRWHLWRILQPPRSDVTTAVTVEASSLISVLAVWSYLGLVASAVPPVAQAAPSSRRAPSRASWRSWAPALCCQAPPAWRTCSTPGSLRCVTAERVTAGHVLRCDRTRWCCSQESWSIGLCRLWLACLTASMCHDVNSVQKPATARFTYRSNSQQLQTRAESLRQVLFNIIYDILLGTKLTWHALCPVIDSMNHSSASQVSDTCCGNI